MAQLITTILQFISAMFSSKPVAPSGPQRITDVEHIKHWEALRLSAYLPTPNDRWTIGWGHTKGVKKGDTCTEAEAEVFLREDLEWVEDAIDELVVPKLTQNQRNALGSFVFNIGRTNFANSTLLRKLNANDFEGAAAEFPRWNKQKGRVLKGLTRRRAMEQKIFMTEGTTDG